MFRLKIRVAARANKNEIIKEPSGAWKVRVTAAPTAGKANDQVIELISEEFKVAKSNIVIVKGLRGKDKTIEIQM
ncbi:MAG: DUF167 domain-containing protein [Patescibacteria group bacterium]|jgi:hypothetical protein